MDFIDYFCGIGTIRLGMEQAEHRCVYSIENDKYKRMIYRAIFGREPDAGDIRNTKGEQLPRADIWCFGFPCKDISRARKGVGIKGKQSSMFFEIMRLLSEIKEEYKPTYLLIENVKDLLTINKGWDMFYVLNYVDELGYDCEWQVLDSKDFGIPQHRERLFIVGHLRGKRSREVFPIRRNCENSCIQIGNIMGIKGFDILRRCYSLDGISPTLNTCNGGNRHAKFYYPTEGGYKIRRLTPKEYWKLQGISEYIIDKVISEGISDRQLYAGAGDSCTVNVVYDIAKRL